MLRGPRRRPGNVESRDWLVRVHHISRDRNAAVDKLAELGQSLTRDGSVFAVPPGIVNVKVEEEQFHWKESRRR
ncbi:hypothetical protein V6N13_060284 [Hibiscus sabdariffa]